MRIFKSLALGLFATVVLVALDFFVPSTDHFLDYVFEPGTMCATRIFGGLHGLEPLLTAIAVDAILFGCLFLLLWWIVDKARSFGG